MCSYQSDDGTIVWVGDISVILLYGLNVLYITNKHFSTISASPRNPTPGRAMLICRASYNTSGSIVTCLSRIEERSYLLLLDVRWNHTERGSPAKNLQHVPQTTESRHQRINAQQSKLRPDRQLCMLGVALFGCRRVLQPKRFTRRSTRQEMLSPPLPRAAFADTIAARQPSYP